MQIEKVNIDDQDANIRKFVKERKPHLYILTPVYGGMCHISYLTCILATKELFAKMECPLTIEFCKNDSLVSRARNNLVAKAMHNPATTHILFIDSDITWNPFDVFRLLMDDKHLVGGVYPLKRYNWDRLKPSTTESGKPSNIDTWVERRNKTSLKDFIDEESMIQCNMVNYNLNYLSPEIKIENGLIRVKHMATGFMMIRRDTLEKMMYAFPSTKYTDDVGFLQGEQNKYAYALFDCGVEEGHYMSEDWMFCNRWRKMGGEVFYDIHICLTHTGPEDYRGAYIASLPIQINAST
jgi:hypothetical protein